MPASVARSMRTFIGITIFGADFRSSQVPARVRREIRSGRLTTGRGQDRINSEISRRTGMFSSDSTAATKATSCSGGSGKTVPGTTYIMSSTTLEPSSMNSSGVLAMKSPGAMKASSFSGRCASTAGGRRYNRCMLKAANCSSRRSCGRPCNWAMVDRSSSAAASAGCAVTWCTSLFHTGARSRPSKAIWHSACIPIGAAGNWSPATATFVFAEITCAPSVSSGTACRRRGAQLRHRLQHGVDIARLGTMVDDRHADRETIANNGGGRRGDAGFV